MSKYDSITAIFNQYSPPEALDLYALRRASPSRKKGGTLADFYAEVLNSSRETYHEKSAKEIEVIMAQNRRLIENKNKRR